MYHQERSRVKSIEYILKSSNIDVLNPNATFYLKKRADRNGKMFFLILFFIFFMIRTRILSDLKNSASKKCQFNYRFFLNN